MRIRDIDFPEPLVEAQRNGSLVVFAGAGVSKAPPSNLPDFRGLATRIASGSSKPDGVEPLDRFLGRLAQVGTDVHSIAQSILGAFDSKPNELHRALVSVFRSEQDLKIVTTNLDDHFTTAVMQLFGPDVSTYYAPALPLGHDFNGVVYLHGCVNRTPKQLVLTDSDFGRAYLTEAWATRFLQAMFEKYTVLFVGYSHGDTVMNYLSRALPAGSKARFALTKPGNDSFWAFRGVIPVSYQTKRGRYPHCRAVEAVEEWGRRAKWGALSHEKKIKEIVALSPPVGAEDADYMKTALKDLRGVRFFVRYASGVEWLWWCTNNVEAFRDAFKPSIHEDETGREVAACFAGWFAENFVCGSPDDALDVLRRQGSSLNTLFWHAIVGHLANCQPLPDAVTLARWVLVILESSRAEWDTDELAWLLNRCVGQEHTHTAILLFEHLTKPRAMLKPCRWPTTDSREGADLDVTVLGGGYRMKECWEEVFKPNLAILAKRIEPIVTSHLQQAHRIVCSVGKAKDGFDLISFGRLAIEPHDQNRQPDDFDAVIDAARDVIESMLENDPRRADAIIESWSVSDSPILRRLAIHGVAEDLRMDADERIALLLGKSLVFTRGARHEVFRLLKLGYPNASEAMRIRLLQEVDAGPPTPAGEDDQELRQQCIFSLFSWLHEADPDCPLAGARFESMRERYPGLRVSEYPDLYTWDTSWWGEEFTVDELLKKDPREDIEWLLSYRGDGFHEPDRESLLAAVGEAVAQQFDWGWQLATVLETRGEWTSDLWKGVFIGWRKGKMREEELTQVLAMLGHQTQLYRFAALIADILVKKARGGPDEMPASCLSLARAVADKLWDVCADTHRGEVVPHSDNWLDDAIADTGGRLTEFWLHALSRMHVAAGDAWAGIPQELGESLGKAVSGDSPTAEFGRVILASQTRFLAAVDAKWTCENLLPLLDWANNERQAEQAWHGYMGGGWWNENVLPVLMPLYEQTFRRLGDHFTRGLRTQFSKHLASIAIFGSPNPISAGWLARYLSAVDEQDRIDFASSVAIYLASMEEESVKALWERWLAEYWSRRITGIPLPLSQDESTQMVYWVVHLGPVLPQAVDRVCSSPAPRLQDSTLYKELVQREYTSRYPQSVTPLVLYVLEDAPQPFYHCRYVERLVRSLLATDASRKDLLGLCHRLAELGCQNAQELGKLANGHD